MNIDLKSSGVSVRFELKEEKIFFNGLGFDENDYIFSQNGTPLTYAFLLGGAYRGKQFQRYGAVGEALKYVKHDVYRTDGKIRLVVTEENERLSVTTEYVLYEKERVVETFKRVKNISEDKLLLDCVCPFAAKGIMQSSDKRLPFFYKPFNCWLSEANFEKTDLNEEGFAFYDKMTRYNKFNISSNGTQTTNRYLPMGVFENEESGFLAFELTPKGSWSYEIECDYDETDTLSLIVTGKNYTDNAWFKTLNPNEEYVTEKVRLTGAKSLDGVVENLTLFRRLIKTEHKNCAYNYVIYNNYMHNTYDNPTEKSDAVDIVNAAEFGADYYVVDAGWHDQRINGISPTQAIGRWTENVENYPNGFIKTIEKVRSYGMRFGLWVELQSFGKYCIEPDLLDEDCFFHINGVRPIGNNRYQLNYAEKKVRDYADGVMDRIIRNYRPDYVKIDYNQTAFGNDCATGSRTEGVALHFSAYEEWFEKLQKRYPDVIFETCASGGMRNDANTVRYSNVISVSDQSNYVLYPYIIANLPVALLPEQSGVWNIPIKTGEHPETSAEEVIMNCINTFYGVMHLSSKLYLVKEEFRPLIREGIKYYKELADIKANAIPVMPDGFTKYGSNTVCTGFKTDKKLYLSFYNLSDEEVDLIRDLSKYGVKNAKIAYPASADNKFLLSNGLLSLHLKPKTARAMEFELE